MSYETSKVLRSHMSWWVSRNRRVEVQISREPPFTAAVMVGDDVRQYGGLTIDDLHELAAFIKEEIGP